jgi:hypothetical protein
MAILIPLRGLFTNCLSFARQCSIDDCLSDLYSVRARLVVFSMSYYQFTMEALMPGIEIPKPLTIG